jgi:serine/alanine adding enzyme
VIEGEMKFRARYLGARDADGSPLRGVLPLYHVYTRFFGHHVMSVPLMNYGGPVGDAAARQALATWALGEAKDTKADGVVLRTRTRVPGEFPFSAGKVTVLLQLGESAERMWQSAFDAKFRNKIKRPQRDGMVTRFGATHLDDFYTVFAANMRDLGTPVLARRIFERIVELFPDLALIGVTYWKERPVAGGFGFIWRDEFEMTWSSSLKELRAAKPNMLLYWDYMRELIDRGVRRFNFGRSTPGTGPHEFKLSWGGVDEALPWIQWPENGGATSAGGVANLASAVWRRLPVGVTRAVGPVVARQLPWW